MSNLSSRTKTALLVAAVIGVVILAAVWRQNGNPFRKFTQPQGQKGLQSQKIKVVDPKLQAGPYKCPSISEFCQLGKQINKDGLIVGFGATIASGSPVLATFDGHVQSLETTLPKSLGGEKLTVVYLDNAQKYLRTIYYFKGTASKNNVNVKEGEEIGKTGEDMNYYDGITLMIQIIKNDPQTGEKLKLTTQDFK